MVSCFETPYSELQTFLLPFLLDFPNEQILLLLYFLGLGVYSETEDHSHHLVLLISQKSVLLRGHHTPYRYSTLLISDSLSFPLL